MDTTEDNKSFYWESTGKHQALNDKLHKLIPPADSVPDARGKNKALEKLRVATNCYYDLYNNGLCNRREEFARVMGFRAGVLVKYLDRDDQLEARMDEIILAAALEQGLAKIVEL